MQLKKIICSIFFVFLTLSLTFAFTNNSNEKYWKLLEKAEVAFDAGNLGDAIQFAEMAKNQKKQEKKLIIKEIENALVPTEVNNVGDSIYDIMAVLEKRDEISVLKTLHEVFDLYSIETFNDSMTALLDFLNKQVDYPEVDFLMGKIFIAEGELSVARRFLLSAWEHSDILDIPLVKYEIIYTIARLEKLAHNFAEYEKWMLLIIADDLNLYANGNITPFFDSVLRTLKRENSLDKILLMYRIENTIDVKIYYELATYYFDKKEFDRAFELTTQALLLSVTKLERIIKSRLQNYQYTNFSNILNEMKKYSDVENWAVEKKFWENLILFADLIQMKNSSIIANEVYTNVYTWCPNVTIANTAKLRLSVE